MSQEVLERFLQITNDLIGKRNRWHNSVATLDDPMCGVTIPARPFTSRPASGGASLWLPLPSGRVSTYGFDSARGHLLTNNHVVEGCDTVAISGIGTPAP
jgi:hypothetical protein